MNLVRVSVPAVRKHICAGELSENRSGDKTYRVTFNLLELSLVNGKHGSETFSRWRIAEGENWNVKTGGWSLGRKGRYTREVLRAKTKAITYAVATVYSD